MRTTFPDLARALALFGIAVVNVMVFAWPPSTGYYPDALDTDLDRLAYFLVCALFLFKSYTLFSFMFGAGFAFQMDAAQRAQAGFAARYLRRMLGLLVLGVINLSFLFWGDILVLYSVLGTLLFLFRNASVQRLVRWGRIVYLLQVGVVLLLAGFTWLGSTFAPEGMQAARQGFEEDAESARRGFGATVFLDVAAYRMRVWGENVAFGLALQGFGVFAFLLLGLAAVRQGLLADPAHAFWSMARRVHLPAGLLLSAVGAGLIAANPDPLDWRWMLGLAVIVLASPLSTSGYLGVVAAWSTREATPLRRFLERSGSISLTGYLLQGVLMSWLFSGYGLGLFAEVGAAACTAIAAVVALVVAASCSAWRMRFERGPAEAVLRAWTYLRA